ncbi:CpsD/CapB family tyrosine-protein kinase [Paenibacillus sp. J2TS4]|uniref:CpsD/CapB family tyrosine-protein kinase n=1 Tax=Paenibacillus sp. J2TS4 TaxID=2807194 RepID=UPI001B2C775D|nr:CpsD/CapB family tyrosine-protein kinase [Paenibacillus sp. J2TS4]GIP36196.1 tyrosine protein kinase [Paenibacillus sp. J2TS4]
MATLANRALIAHVNPQSKAAEDFKFLRTRIDYSLSKQSNPVLLVTSAKKGEGKTYVAANLAVSFAQSGRKVLLIDANLAEPDLHHWFAKSNELGLAEVLSGSCDPQEGLHNTMQDNLTLFCAGTAFKHASDLLISGQIGGLLEKLKEQYDVIVIDSPAAGQSADSLYLAAQSSGTLLVVKGGSVKPDEIRQLMKDFEHVHGQLIGYVFH